MNRDEAISKLYRELQEHKTALCRIRGLSKELAGLTHCIGGPLNDNNLQYNSEQLKDWFRVEGSANEITSLVDAELVADSRSCLADFE